VPISNRLYWVLHSLVGHKVPAVQHSVQASGGFCTWQFSQVQDPVKSLICSYSDISGGICEMLAAKWLEAHAKNGSIVNWMLDAGGQVNPDRVRQLMQWFVIGTTMRAGAMAGCPGNGAQGHSMVTEQWLRTHGVVRRRHISGGTPLLGGGVYHLPRNAVGQRGHPRPNFAGEIARAITNSPGSYKMVGITGPRFAHAMAAWSDQDVSFFDPNFGEFWFARPADFHAWFPLFWQLTGYATPMLGLGEFYEIDEYGQSA